MGETEPIYLQITDDFILGFNFGRFGSVWGFNLAFIFIRFGIEFRKPKDVKWLKFDIMWGRFYKDLVNK